MNRCLWTANVCIDHMLFMRSILVFLTQWNRLAAVLSHRVDVSRVVSLLPLWCSPVCQTWFLSVLFAAISFTIKKRSCHCARHPRRSCQVRSLESTDFTPSHFSDGKWDDGCFTKRSLTGEIVARCPCALLFSRWFVVTLLISFACRDVDLVPFKFLVLGSWPSPAFCVKQVPDKASCFWYVFLFGFETCMSFLFLFRLEQEVCWQRFWPSE